MPQFSLRRLFVSVTIIAVGFALISAKTRLSPLKFASPSIELILLLMLGASLVGAGIGNLFRRPMLGAIVGFALTDTGLIVASFFTQAT